MRDTTETFGTPRDARSISSRLQRLRFLREPAAVRQQTRARAQAIINAEIQRRPLQPSQLARDLAAGAYDEPRPGELQALEEWEQFGL